jgi:dUTP pyrophosphatase
MATSVNDANIMLLKIYVENDELRQLYYDYITRVFKNVYAEYPDAGFDLFVPSDASLNPSETTKLDLGIKCAAFINGKPSSFYVYPRSSISKTKLRLANSVGIIDSGYRGSLAAAFDNIGVNNVTVQKGTRLLQICSPNLTPIKVEIVGSEDVLGATQRGSGGFGSTGV